MLAHKPDAPPFAPFATAATDRARIRVHVIGAGAMGARHVRVFAAAGADVTVEDADSVRARDVADRFDSRVARMRSLADRAKIQLVVVATPTPTHADVAASAFDLGAHVLVEKPLAATVAAAERLAKRALAARRFLFVGMSERFHPVVRALRARIQPGDVTRLTFHRFGASSSTQPALLNLGVHDLDLALHLTRAELVVASARTLAHDASFVHLVATPAASAIEASLAAGASAMSGPRERRLTVDLASGERFEGNLLDPSLTRFAPNGSGSAETRAGEAVPLDKDEPLALQAEAILRGIAGGDAGALASAADGVRVLRLVESALRLQRAASPETQMGK